MTSAEAKRYVLGSLVLAGIVAGVGDLAGGRLPKLRILIGMVIAGAALSIAADPAPKLAGSLALLILVSALMAGGPTVSRKIVALTSDQRPSSNPADRRPVPGRPGAYTLDQYPGIVFDAGGASSSY